MDSVNQVEFIDADTAGKQTVGAYVVTKEDNLVLVHRTQGLKHNEPTAESSQAGAGDRIAVGSRYRR